MYVLLVIFIVLAAILMVLTVVIQNSKGGGLASSFSSSNQIMGVRKTTGILEKTTWTLAAIMVVLSIASAYTLTGKSASTSVMQQDAAVQRAINPNNVQAFPAADEPAAEAPAAEAPAAENN